MQFQLWFQYFLEFYNHKIDSQTLEITSKLKQNNNKWISPLYISILDFEIEIVYLFIGTTLYVVS